MHDRAREQARRLAQQAWEAGWPHLRRRLPESALPEALQPADQRLARRMARDAEAVRRAHAAAVAAHTSAVARRERVLRRSRRAVPTWSVVGGGAALATVPLTDGAAVAFGAVAVAGGLRVLAAVWRLRRPPSVPPAPSIMPGPPPPHPRSAAFPAVRRLEQARGALQSLVPLVGPAGREAVEEAWQAAAEADVALRWQAARFAAAEPHTGVDVVLLAALESGVAEQERLVQGVADLVSASARPHDASHLQDVADRLHGLAAGLRELR